MEEQTFRPEQLLEHAPWLNALARSLVRDDAQAADAVQETWLSILKRPPETLSGALLSKVLRRRISDGRRQESARREHERQSARSEGDSSTPSQLLERIEAQRQLVGFVLELGEPYRSTVIFRFFEELSPKRIARRQGVSVTTVRTRLRKAMSLLRSRLDRAYGSRETWFATLASLLALDQHTFSMVNAPAPSTVSGSSFGFLAMGVVMKKTIILSLALVLLLAGFSAYLG